MSDFIVVNDQTNPADLVQHLSHSNQLTEVMHKACELYGFELAIDPDVQFRMRAKSLTHEPS